MNEESHGACGTVRCSAGGCVCTALQGGDATTLQQPAAIHAGSAFNVLCHLCRHALVPNSTACIWSAQLDTTKHIGLLCCMPAT